MPRVHATAGKAQCRYCGEQISIKSLTMHILKSHPRPVRHNLMPTLVRKPLAGIKAPLE